MQDLGEPSARRRRVLMSRDQDEHGLSIHDEPLWVSKEEVHENMD